MWLVKAPESTGAAGNGASIPSPFPFIERKAAAAHYERRTWVGGIHSRGHPGKELSDVTLVRDRELNMPPVTFANLA